MEEGGGPKSLMECGDKGSRMEGVERRTSNGRCQMDGVGWRVVMEGGEMESGDGGR